MLKAYLLSSKYKVAPFPRHTQHSSVAAAGDHVAIAGARRKVVRQQMSLSELAQPGIRQELSERVQHRLQTELEQTSLSNHPREKEQVCG